MSDGDRLGEQIGTAVEGDGVRWLALLIREAFMVLVSGIEKRYGLRRQAESRFNCPRCGWRA